MTDARVHDPVKDACPKWAAAHGPWGPAHGMVLLSEYGEGRQNDRRTPTRAPGELPWRKKHAPRDRGFGNCTARRIGAGTRGPVFRHGVGPFPDDHSGGGPTGPRRTHGLAGEGPPDDVSVVFRPYPTPRLRSLFDANAFLATERQGALHVLTEERGLTQLNMDLARGELSFSKPEQKPIHRFPAHFIGLLAQEHSHWQWGWVAEEKGSMNPLVLKSAREIREFGHQQKFPELTYAEIALGCGDDRPWFNGDYLATVACHLCKADFYSRRRTETHPDCSCTGSSPLPMCSRKPATSRRTSVGSFSKPWPSGRTPCDSNTREIIRAYAAQKTSRSPRSPDRRTANRLAFSRPYLHRFRGVGWDLRDRVPPGTQAGVQEGLMVERALPREGMKINGLADPLTPGFRVLGPPYGTSVNNCMVPGTPYGFRAGRILPVGCWAQRRARVLRRPAESAARAAVRAGSRCAVVRHRGRGPTCKPGRAAGGVVKSEACRFSTVWKRSCASRNLERCPSASTARRSPMP